MPVLFIQMGVSLLTVALCLPLIRGKVRKNALYGMRTARTLKGSDGEWYSTNRRVALTMLQTSLISIGADFALGWMPMATVVRYSVATALLLASVLVPLLLHRRLLFVAD